MAQVKARRLRREPFAQPYVALREHLIAARKEAGVTQQALAEGLGVPQSFVAKYERGERSIDVVEFAAIARNLRIDVSKVIAAVAAKM